MEPKREYPGYPEVCLTNVERLFGLRRPRNGSLMGPFVVFSKLNDYVKYVVIAWPKCGTKSMNKCFTSLGYKVFDVPQVAAYTESLDLYGRQKISFAELAKMGFQIDVSLSLSFN